MPISKPRCSANSSRMLRVYLEALLCRLIGIGCRADGDLFPALHLLQVAPQQPRGLLLDVDLALEVDAVAHLHELVRVARIAVFAGELAAAIRIDRPGKRHAPIGDTAVQQPARRQREVLDKMPLP